MPFKKITPGAAAVAPLIDHTLLKPDATERDILRLCREARHYGFATVCIHPSRIRLAADALAGSPVKVDTVIGFPLGAARTEVKAFEAADAVARGARELDMVIALGALKDRRYAEVVRDIRAVVAAASPAIVKVIIETALLSKQEKVTACRLVADAGAAFVKTCTGFSGGGATEQDVRLMWKTVGRKIGVKASGGIRTLADARRMIEAGANRIGTSSGVAIVTGVDVL